jgi:hypothetical protein
MRFKFIIENVFKNGGRWSGAGPHSLIIPSLGKNNRYGSKNSSIKRLID